MRYSIRRFSTVGKLLRSGLARATKSPGAAAGAVAGAGGSVVLTTINPGLAAFPTVSTSTAVGKAIPLPREVRLWLAKKSRQMMSDPESYRAAGLQVPWASEFASKLERGIDGSRVGQLLNPRLRTLQGSKAVKKLEETTKKVHRRVEKVSSGIQSGLSKFPTTGTTVTSLKH